MAGFSLEAPNVHHTRVEGYDLARALAIVGMILVNFQVFLLEAPSGDAASVPWQWLSHLPSGRASALFVTLAGAGVSILGRGDRARSARWTLLRRALFLIVAGNLLRLVWSIDILHFYAFYLVFAALLIRASNRVIMTLTGLLLAGGLVIGLTLGDLSRDDYEYFSPLGMTIDVFVGGVHPVVPWLAFVLVGMWIGRHDVRDPRTRAAFMIGGACAAVGAELLSLALGALTARAAPPELAPALRVLATGWSPDPLYVVGAAGSSVFVIGLAQTIVERWRERALVRALVSTGQLALSIYVWHALAGAGIPRWALGLADAMSAGSVALYWVVFSLGTIVLAYFYRRRFRVGPLERALRFVGPSPRSGDPAPAETVAGLPPRWWPSAAVLLTLGLAFVVLARFAGAREPSIGCPPDLAALPIDGGVPGELTLLCPHRDHALQVAGDERIIIEVVSGQDTYLEIFRGDERVAHDDDSGVGLDPRFEGTLAPGHYRVRVRPYASGTGAYLLRARPAR